MQRAENSNDSILAAITHILGLLTGFLGPLVIFLLRSEEDLVKDQAREALNFQVTMLLGAILGGLLTVVFVGFLIVLAVGLTDTVLSIVAAVRAYEGQRYRYPICIRFLNPPHYPHRSRPTYRGR